MMKLKIDRVKNACCWLLCLALLQGQAQNTAGSSDAKAEQLMDKAIGNAMAEKNIGVTYEGIALSLKQPKDIFTLPVYEQIRGGYFYLNNNKFEMNMGMMKSISDGQLMVLVDEASKVMYVDSVRDELIPGDTLQHLEMAKTLEQTFGESTFHYEGEELLNNIVCHKIKATITASDAPCPYVYYWINKQNGQLYLMAEYQNKAYDVYWFNKVGKAPANYNYKIQLPGRELDNFHGYEVMDNRFINIRENK